MYSLATQAGRHGKVSACGFIFKTNSSTHLCSTCFCACSAYMFYPETGGKKKIKQQ